MQMIWLTTPKIANQFSNALSFSFLVKRNLLEQEQQEQKKKKNHVTCR